MHPVFMVSFFYRMNEDAKAGPSEGVVSCQDCLAQFSVSLDVRFSSSHRIGLIHLILCFTFPAALFLHGGRPMHTDRFNRCRAINLDPFEADPIFGTTTTTPHHSPGDVGGFPFVPPLRNTTLVNNTCTVRPTRA